MNDLEQVVTALVHSIEQSYPDYLSAPFRVQELHQSIIPYRQRRRELGVETNQDYEAALTRLLAGEGGFLLVPEELRSTLSEELRSPNPDIARFRRYGSVDIKLTELAIAVAAHDSSASSTSAAQSDRSAPAPAVRPEPVVPASAVAVATPPAAPSVAAEQARRTPEPTSAAAGAPVESDLPAAVSARTPLVNPSVAARAAGKGKGGQEQPRSTPAKKPKRTVASSKTKTSPPTAEIEENRMPSVQRTITASAVGGSCRYCDGALPDGRTMTYCPHCGQDLTVQHCPACSTELEVGWKFCITCGRRVAE